MLLLFSISQEDLLATIEEGGDVHSEVAFPLSLTPIMIIINLPPTY